MAMTMTMAMAMGIRRRIRMRNLLRLLPFLSPVSTFTLRTSQQQHLLVQQHHLYSNTITTTTSLNSADTNKNSESSSTDDDHNNNNNNNNNNLLVLGVCGGIGSGKSLACQILVEELGCWAHLEADTIAHKVYEPHSPAIPQIATHFGQRVINTVNMNNDTAADDNDDDATATAGTINRKELGAIVFSSPQKMAQLEKIVWPHVRQEIKTIIESYRQKASSMISSTSTSSSKSSSFSTRPILILEAAVLIDAGWDDLLDGLWVIRVSPEVALQRLVTSRGLAPDDALRRIRAQEGRRGIGRTALQNEIDCGVVSSVIQNDRTIDELRTELRVALDKQANWY